jgi:hypothetical protein
MGSVFDQVTPVLGPHLSEQGLCSGALLNVVDCIESAESKGRDPRFRLRHRQARAGSQTPS